MITYNHQYNQYPIQCCEHRTYGYSVDTLAKLDSLLAHMTTRFSKVLFVRFDVRYPQELAYSVDNILFSNFMGTLVRYCQRKDYAPAYLWVREHDSALNHHYHCIMLFNGHKIQNSYGVLKKAQELWALQLNTAVPGLVNFCAPTAMPNQYWLMLRNNQQNTNDMYNQGFQWGSYLAKVDTKETNLHGVRTVGSSRIPKTLYQNSLANYKNSQETTK